MLHQKLFVAKLLKLNLVFGIEFDISEKITGLYICGGKSEPVNFGFDDFEILMFKVSKSVFVNSQIKKKIYMRPYIYNLFFSIHFKRELTGSRPHFWS